MSKCAVVLTNPMSSGRAVTSEGVTVTSVLGTVAGQESLAPGDCPGFIVLSPAEYSLAVNSPFNLSAEDGAAVSAAIVGTWITAWCVTALYRVINSAEPESE